MTAPPETASNLAAGRQAVQERAQQLIEFARGRLGLDDRQPWKFVSARGKFSKIFFEVEEGEGARKRFLVGKYSDSQQAQGAFAILTKLRQEGMRPPAEFTVVEPIAHFPEEHLLIQEKAPGLSVLEMVKPRGFANVDRVAERSAGWLNALQRVCDCPPDAPPAAPVIERCVNELSEALPRSSALIQDCGGRLLVRIAAAEGQSGSASHGDFHPMNVFIDDRRVSAIDVDTYAGRNPVYDAAYFLAESAIFGFQHSGRFSHSDELRGAFLEELEHLRGNPLAREDLAAYAALAFLRGLHFDLCILRTGNSELPEPYLGAICRSLERRQPVFADE